MVICGWFYLCRMTLKQNVQAVPGWRLLHFSIFFLSKHFAYDNRRMLCLENMVDVTVFPSIAVICFLLTVARQYNTFPNWVLFWIWEALCILVFGRLTIHTVFFYWGSSSDSWWRGRLSKLTVWSFSHNILICISLFISGYYSVEERFLVYRDVQMMTRSCM